MVAVNTIVDERVFRYRTEGVDDAKAKADRVATSYERVAGAEDRVTASSDKVARAKEKMAAALERAQRQAEADARAYEVMRAAQDAAQQSLTAMSEAQVRAAQASAQADRAANDNAAAVKQQGEAYQAAGRFIAEHPVLALAASAAAARGLSGFASSAAVSLASASASTARYAAASAEMGSATATGAAAAARGLGLASSAASGAAGGLAAYANGVSGMTSTVGLLARGLALVPPLLVPVAAGFVAFAAVSAFLDKAYADLDKLIGLGKQAEGLDLSAPFLKSFTGLGAQFRIEVEQMQAALQRSSSFLQDRFGQASVASRVFGEVDPAGTLRASQQLALAQSTEERIRAVLAGMVELEQRGERLTALNVGEKVFGADLVERLRRGEGSIAQFVESLNDARGKEILSQADVTRAVALQREIEDVKREIDRAMASTFDFSGAAVRLNEIWLGMLKPVRDVAQTIADATRGGDAATMRTIAGLQDRARSIETVSIPRAVNQGDAAVVASLREQVVGLQNEIDRLSMTMTSSAEKIDSAIGRVPPPLRMMSDELANLVAEADRAARSMDGTASSASAAGSAMAGAAVKARGFAEALASIQQANPNLSGTLGLLDRIGKVNQSVAEGVKGVTENFNAGKLTDTEAQQQIVRLNEQAAASIKALRTEAEKPFTGYVREAEIGKLDDLGQALARASDRFAETRQKAVSYYDLRIERASPEARGAIEAEKVQALGKLDVAYQQNAAAARKAAAERAAADKAGSEGADAYDNAIRRAQDQIRELELQAKTAGKTSEEVVRLTEANRLRRAADQAGRSGEAGVAEDIERTAAALAKQRAATDEAIEAHRRLQEGTRALGDETTRFLDGFLLGTTSLTSAFENMARSLASSGLQAILTGQGSLAGLMGTAPKEKGDLGGLLGGQMPSFLRDAVKDGAKAGTEAGAGAGVAGGLSEIFGGASGKSLLAGAAGIAMIGGSYSIGQQQKGVTGMVGGALSGALGGAMLGSQIGAVGGPLGAAIGAGVGLIGSLLGQSEAKRQREKEIQGKLQELKDAYNAQKASIDLFRSGLRGEATGGVEGAIKQAFAQMIAANKTASQGGDQAAADAMVQEFQQFAARMRAQVRAAMGGTLDEIARGFGTNGPFAQAAAATHQLGEAMRAWLDDVNRAQDAFSTEGLAAIYQGLLATLQPTPEMSSTAKEYQRIQGTAAALQQELTRLSGSAEGAAAAIREGVTKALDTLRASFNADLDVRINDAQGKGYLNDVVDLLKEVSGLRLDASLVGGDLGKVDTYFAAAAQKIVTESQLTGDAFSALVTQFPALNGLVRAYSAALEDQAATLEAVAERARGYADRLFAAQNDTSSLNGQLAAFDRSALQARAEETKAGGQAMADLEKAMAAERVKIIDDFGRQAAEAAAAAEKAIADRRLGYADRLFAAGNDTTTLAGQLAAFDRKAEQERQAEIAAGGQAIADLEAAQYAERLKLVTDYQSQAAEAEKQRLEAAQQAFDTFARNIRTFVDGLRAGSSSPLAPQARLAAAQSQYDAQLALARSGDRTALDGITAYASDLLDAAKGFYASSAQFQAIFGQVTGQLTALPTQVSAEQFIVNAIDASKTATVTATQAMQAALKTAIDAGNASATAAALLPQFNTLTATTGGLLNYGQFLSATGGLATASEQQAARTIFASLDRNNDGQLSKLELINAQTVATAGNTGQTKNAVDYLGALGVQQKGLLDAINSWSAATQTNTGNTKNAIDGLNTLNAQQKSLLDQVNTWTNATYSNTGATNASVVATYNSVNQSNAILGQLQAINATTDKSAADTLAQMFGLIGIQIKALENLQNANIKSGARASYATGGLISGPGTGTSDSIAAMLSNGEYVLTAEATRRLGVPLLDALNDNRMAMPAVAMPLPRPVAMGSNDNGAILAALQQQNALLQQQVALLQQQIRATVAGAEHVADHVDRTTDAVEDGQRTAAALAA